MPQRGSLLPYRGVLSFLSKAREASGSETPRVHHAARRRGGVAARGARAAGRPSQKDRGVCVWRRKRSCRSGLRTGAATGAGATWLVRGPNIHVDYRWASGDRLKAEVAEMVELAPDVILCGATQLTGEFQRKT